MLMQRLAIPCPTKTPQNRLIPLSLMTFFSYFVNIPVSPVPNKPPVVLSCDLIGVRIELLTVSTRIPRPFSERLCNPTNGELNILFVHNASKIGVSEL